MGWPLALDQYPGRYIVEYGNYMKHSKVEVYLLKFKLAMHPKLTENVVKELSRADTVGKYMNIHCTTHPYIQSIYLYIYYIHCTYTCVPHILNRRCIYGAIIK